MRTTMWKCFVWGTVLLAVGGAKLASATDITEAMCAPADPPKPAKVSPELVCSTKEDDGLAAIAFGSGGKVIVTGGFHLAGSDHGMVRLRDPATGKSTEAFQFPYRIEAIALSPDGKQLVVGSGGLLQGPRAKPSLVVPGRLTVLSFPDGRELFNLKGGSHSYSALAFSPDGKLLAVGGSRADDTGAPREMTPIVIWDPATGKEKLTLKGQPGTIYGVAFSPDGKTLAVVSTLTGERVGLSGVGHARLWDVDSGKDLIELKGDPGPVWQVSFAPNGKLVATGGADGNVRLWDPATGKELAKLNLGTPVVNALAFSSDGKLIGASGGNKLRADRPGVLKVWELETRKEHCELSGHETNVRTLAFSPDSTRLAAGESNGTLRVWSLGNN